MTSNTGRLYPSEAVINVDGKNSKAMADEIITADKRRLKGPIGRLSREDMKAIEKVLKIQLGIPL